MESEKEDKESVVSESAKLILIPALKFGAFTGCSGLLVGGIVGLFRMPTPGLFAAASGFQWFALGSTFWATRGAILRYRYLDNHAPRDRLHVSTFAGGLTGGSIGGLIRGTPNILPGAIMFALFGLAGQSIYNHLDDAHTQSVLLTRNQPPPSSSFWTRLAASKYVPVKVLSDAEYESMLRERLLAVEAEIALVDEKIERLRVQGVQSEERKDGEERRGEEMGSGESR